jgi:LacI family transcriptional regulator
MAKFTALFDTLQREILAGKYNHGKRLPSETELALRHKVSRPTAARALRELQQMGVITRRAGSGSYLQPPPENNQKSALTFGLLVPGLGSTEILDPISNEITRYTQSLGGQVLWGEAGAAATKAEDALALCRSYVQSRVDGVFFAPLERAKNRLAANAAVTGELLQAGIPVVLLDRDATEFPERSNLDLVGIDNFSASMEMTAHLVAQGARRICFLARPQYPSTTDLRRLGCEEALRRAGLAIDYPIAHYGEPDDAAFVKAILADARPDAILCSNDQTAALLLQTLAGMSVRVPHSIRVAGFDDVRYATLLAVPLTTMHQPCRELGRVAVKALMERIAEPTLPPRQILLQARLIPRASTD